MCVWCACIMCVHVHVGACVCVTEVDTGCFPPLLSTSLRQGSCGTPELTDFSLLWGIPRFCSPVLGLPAAGVAFHVYLDTRDLNCSPPACTRFTHGASSPGPRLEQGYLVQTPALTHPSPSVSTKPSLLGCFSSQDILEIALLS